MRTVVRAGGRPGSAARHRATAPAEQSRGRPSEVVQRRGHQRRVTNEPRPQMMESMPWRHGWRRSERASHQVATPARAQRGRAVPNEQQEMAGPAPGRSARRGRGCRDQDAERPRALQRHARPSPPRRRAEDSPRWPAPRVARSVDRSPDVRRSDVHHPPHRVERRLGDRLGQRRDGHGSRGRLPRPCTRSPAPPPARGSSPRRGSPTMCAPRISPYFLSRMILTKPSVSIEARARPLAVKGNRPTW